MISGAKVVGKKKMSINDEIKEFSKPEIVYIPLVNYTNLECKSLVKKGNKVLKGSIIGKRDDEIDLPIHSSVSGEVIGIEDKLYLNGEQVKCIVIKNNFKEKQEELHGVKAKITDYSKKEYIKLLKSCAVTGMGGSDFPTYLKYNGNLDTIIVNVVECEPYITADYTLAKLKTEEILEAVDAIMEINNMEKGIIAVKNNNTDLIKCFEEYLGTYPNISLKTVRNIYPMGWEKWLIKETLGVEYNKYPGEKGIVVNNISTIYAIYQALKKNTPISRRIITITGENIKNPQNIIVKLGTSLRSIIKELGGYKGVKNLKFIAGGPMMGNSLSSDDLIVTKNLNCVLVIKDDGLNNEIPCIRCGRCVDICPAKISPVLIRDRVNNFEALKNLHPEKCIECGLCSYVCPSKINVREYVKQAKKEIRRH